MYENIDNLKKLNDKQQEAIVLLLLGENNKTVASKVGVDANTLTRWRNSEPFRSVLVDMRLQAIENIELKLQSLGDKALDKLLYLLENADNENNQLKASIFILDKSLQYNQLEIIKRLDAIEERLLSNE